MSAYSFLVLTGYPVMLMLLLAQISHETDRYFMLIFHLLKCIVKKHVYHLCTPRDSQKISNELSAFSADTDAKRRRNDRT